MATGLLLSDAGLRPLFLASAAGALQPLVDDSDRALACPPNA
jgi:hypothetical protein